MSASETAGSEDGATGSFSGAGDPSGEALGEMLAGARQVFDTLQEPLLVLDSELVAREANSSFYEAFSATAEETTGRPLFEIGGGHFDHPSLRDPLETLLGEHKPFEKVKLEGTFEGLGRRAFQVNGRLLSADREDFERILLAIRDVTKQRRLEEDVAKSYGEHANAYVTKPVDLSEITTIVQSIDEFWFQVVRLPSR